MDSFVMFIHGRSLLAMLQRDVSPSLLLQTESFYVLTVGTPPEGTGAVIAVRLRLKHAADMTSLKVTRTVCMQEHGMVTSIISTHRIPPGYLVFTAALDLACAIVMASMLTFSLECRDTRPGQAVYLVGSVPELGSWQVLQGASFSSFEAHQNF